MGRRGRKRQLDLESEYWTLLQTGVGTVAACKLLGIGRKTGYRWRAENGGLAPARLAESARSGRYLSRLERQRIATLRDRGFGVREIARRLDRSASTISRELRRHLRPHDRGVYDGDLAHARAHERLRRPRRPLLARDSDLRQIVQDKLTEEWSPAQIAELSWQFEDGRDGGSGALPLGQPPFAVATGETCPIDAACRSPAGLPPTGRRGVAGVAVRCRGAAVIADLRRPSASRTEGALRVVALGDEAPGSRPVTGSVAGEGSCSRRRLRWRRPPEW